MSDDDAALVAGWIMGALVGFFAGMVWTTDVIVGLGLALAGAFVGAAVAYGVWKVRQP